MAELKTKENEVAVQDFLSKTDDKVHQDCNTIIDIMERVSGKEAKMWGTAIVGFGSYHYKYDSGPEGDMCLIGFSPRKANITLYVLCGFPGQDALLEKLGKHKASGGCLHIKKMEDVDNQVLEEIISQSFAYKKVIHNAADN